MSQNQLLPVWLVNAVSMAADIASGPVQLEFGDNIGIQVKWTGTPTGTLAVQVTMDPVNFAWQTVPFSPAPSQPAGSAGTDWFEINQSSAAYVRLIYTHASGSGTLYAKIAIKSV